MRKLRKIYNIFHNCMMKLDEETAMHINRVAYLGLNFAKKNNFSPEKILELVTVCYLHDIGMIATGTTVRDVIEAEADNVVEHSAAGHVYFKYYIKKSISNIVLHHHTAFNKISGITEHEKYMANAVNIIDRVELILNDGKEYSATEELSKNIEVYIKYNNDEFSSQIKEEYKVLLDDDVLKKYYDGSYIDELREYIDNEFIDEQQYSTMLDSLVYIIESHSASTAGHSHVVAILAKQLAKMLGKNEEEQKHLYYAGLLHDIGKIAIPVNILKSDERLTGDEYEIIKTHTTITKEILNGNVLDEVFYPAISHHENNQGTGYPNGEKNLTLEQQIIRVSDIFTALAEDRYYRRALNNDEVLKIIDGDYQLGNMDETVYNLVVDNSEELYNCVKAENKNVIEGHKKLHNMYCKSVEYLDELRNANIK